MPTVEPTPRMLEARETMRSQAVPIVTRRLHASVEALGERATKLTGHLVASPVAPDRETAGWSLLASASILARNAEDLVAGIGGKDEEDLASGVMWAAVVSGVAGNALIELAAEPDADEAAEGSVDDEGLRSSARLLVREMFGALGAPSSAGASFGKDAVRQIVELLPGLDRPEAARALQTVGVWCAHEDEALAPPPKRGGLLRGRRPGPAVRLGCALAGAFTASVGLAMAEADIGG